MSIIIAGGGMTGATLALAISRLSQGEIPVHLTEARAPSAPHHPGFDARAIALAHETCRQLEKLAIWPALAPGATPITQVHVSERGRFGQVRLDARDYHLPALGQMILLREAGQALFQLLAQAPGVHLHCPARVTQIHRTAQAVNVNLDDGTALQGRLLVAADGTRSGVAQQCGQQWRVHDYQQVAVIATVQTALAHGGRAFERFTASGPLALLPLAGRQCSLVWCWDAAYHAQALAWDDAHFLAQLQRAFGWRLGRFLRVGPRDSYPLRLTVADMPVGQRLVLIGNAAQTLHPVAGQGFNLGMRDALSLAEEIVAAWRAGVDPGSERVLARYQQRRQPDRDATIRLTDGLNALFANEYGPCVFGRTAALRAMSLWPALSQRLTARTLGQVAR